MSQHCVCRVTAIQGKAWCAVYAPVEPWKAWKSRRARQIWQIGANQSQWFDFDGNKMPQSCTSDWSLPSVSQNSASGGTMHQKAVYQLDSTAQGTQCARDLLHLRQNATDTKAPMVASGSHDRAQTCKLYPSTRVTDGAKPSMHELTYGVKRSEVE